jgi:hypothetical protein
MKNFLNISLKVFATILILWKQKFTFSRSKVKVFTLKGQKSK